MPPFEQLTLLIYGSPKGGKTTFASGVDHATKKAGVFNPKALFIATEPGHDFIRNAAARIYDEGLAKHNAANPEKKLANCWQLFQYGVRQLYQLKAQGKLPYNTVVVDIIDNLFSHCYEAMCKQLGLAEPQGNDWNVIRAEWETWLKRLMSIADIVFLTHASEETYEVEISPGITEKRNRTVPTFKGKTKAQFIDGIVNAIGFVTKVGQNRVITFTPSAEHAAGDRTGILELLGPQVNDWRTVSAAYVAKARELGIKVVPKR